MPYLPIEDHGIIGNLHTAALVGLNGSIDWCCLPRFDSPSVFGSLLDDEKGGHFTICSEGTINQVQRYLPESAILVTRSFCEHGLGQIEDFMPIVEDESRGCSVIRRVRCIRGEVKYSVHCCPSPNFARTQFEVQIDGNPVFFRTESGPDFYLNSEVRLEKADGGVTGTLRLKQGEEGSFIFGMQEGAADEVIDPEDQFEKTLGYWQDWMKKCTYVERWDEMMRRSAITLKLLTYQPTGAIVAAPTMALPEVVGGRRNWDYRYAWIRDAAFTLYALMRLGYQSEASDFMEFLASRAREADTGSDVPLHLMYGIEGGADLTEEKLEHLKGYRDSRPVLLGNAAYEQLQLDIYGELLDSIYLYNKYVTPVSVHLWRYCRRLASWVVENWDQPDEGIWETRGGRHNFVFSRLMCWVALDRVSRMSIKYSLPGDRISWMQERDKIYDQIMDLGWSEERQAFRQHYDTHALDAANLLMPLVKFISPTDPRMISTIDATLENLTTDSLVYRYDPEESPDGLQGREGTFCMCTFWLVECLTRCGRLHEARLIFEKMLGYANHVGLFSEQIGNHGEALGNFPQAFTHLSLISAGYNLNRALKPRGCAD